MSNFRSRELLNLCYDYDCMLQIDGVCTGGTGEPCHANWPEHGKGGAMKAHDCYAVPGCRACHMALDQGNKLSCEQRRDIWHRAFWKFLAMLWSDGRLSITMRREGLPEKEGVIARSHSLPPSRRRKSRCTAAANQVKRPEGWRA